MREKNLLFFKQKTGKRKAVNLPKDFEYRVFKPSILKPLPQGFGGSLKTISFFRLTSILQIFWHNSKKPYKIHLLYKENRLAHYSVVLPKYYRFPFMDEYDIEIGPCWTDSQYRGLGLYPAVLQKILETFSKYKKNAWIFCENDNKASIRGIEKAGFEFIGEGRKTKPLGLSILGRYKIESFV